MLAVSNLQTPHSICRVTSRKRTRFNKWLYIASTTDITYGLRHYIRASVMIVWVNVQVNLNYTAFSYFCKFQIQFAYFINFGHQASIRLVYTIVVAFSSYFTK